MKLDLGQLEQDAWPQVKGAFYIRMFRGQPIAQRWPRKGIRPASRSDAWLSAQFAKAGHMAASAYSLDWQTAEYLARHMVNPPRDLLTQAIYGNLYVVEGPDGVVWPVTSKSVPALPEPPPSDGDDTMWEWSMWDEAQDAALDSANQAAKGNYLMAYADTTIKGFRAKVSCIASATYRLTIARLNGANEIVEIVWTGLHQTDRTGRWVLSWQFTVMLTGNTPYVFLVSMVGSSNTYAFPTGMIATQKWLYEWKETARARLAQATPAIGHTVTIQAGGAAPQGLAI